MNTVYIYVKNKPKCPKCDEEAPCLSDFGGLEMCPKCWQKLPIPSGYNQEVIDEIYHYYGYLVFFHPRQRQLCPSCNRVTGPIFAMWKKGSQVCKECWIRFADHYSPKMPGA